jgi:phosphoribosyl 1,2-cyclic phosphate phosphodiesterase
MIVTFLGTGTSYGVPFVGCDCAVCLSTDSRNKRLRASILVEAPAADSAGENGEPFRILVDTGPDLRTQLLRERVSRINAILWTHAHNDHIIGLDDMRPVTNICGYVDGYGNADTIAKITENFAYALVPGRAEPFFPRITPHTVEPFDVLELGPFRVTPLRIAHGRTDILALKFECAGKSFVYATDCSDIYPESWPHFENLDLLSIDALRHREHPTHFSLAQSLAVAERVRPKQTLFTHMAHDLDHEETNAALPHGVRLAFDGLRVEI